MGSKKNWLGSSSTRATKSVQPHGPTHTPNSQSGVAPQSDPQKPEDPKLVLERQRIELELQKLDLEQHKNRRDEQFWFTVAAVGINLTLVKEKVGDPFSLGCATAISIFAAYLVMFRWLRYAKRLPERPFQIKDATFLAQTRYSLQIVRASLVNIPIVIVEASGSWFFLLIIFGSLSVAWYKGATAADHADKDAVPVVRPAEPVAAPYPARSVGSQSSSNGRSR